MWKKRKRRKKAPLSEKEKQRKMLKNSEWILVGIFFVAVSEIVIKKYELTWRYLPYTCAVLWVLAMQIFLRMVHIFTRGATYFLNSLKDL